jgi:starch synthase (maltosyl-transferring)
MNHFMAATLSSNYGIYGPAYEELNHEAVPGKEEYQNSEKYQIKHYDWTVENKVTWMMRTVNKARKTLSSLQQTRNFRVLNLENQALFAYLKWEGEEKVVCVVNLDPYNAQEGWLQLPLDLLPLKEGGYRLHDLISGADYPWREEWNYVRLDPARPCHLFRVMM